MWTAKDRPEFVTLVHSIRGVPVIKMSGEVDLLSSASFRKVLSEVVPVSGVIIVDISGLDFMDADGVGILESTTQNLRRSGGEVRIVMKNSPVARTLDVTGMYRTFEYFPNVTSALLDRTA